MGVQIAVFDACVLYPAPLRDLLMHLAISEIFDAKWSDAIHDEWTRSVLENRTDITPDQLLRTRRLMDAHVMDGLVSGYESIIPTLTLPDPDDRHVLAAAIHCSADTIVTYNLRDFPVSSLAPHGIIARHPDPFVKSLLEENTDAVCEAIQRQRFNLKNPPRSAEELLQTFESQGLIESVALLRPMADRL